MVTPAPQKPLNIGIVGGGIAGLYSALLLQREGHNVQIFEGTGYVGGRVRTHYFSTEKDQYFEAGAMRIPKSKFHDITFALIDHVNSLVPQDKHLAVIPYVLNAPGNLLLVNGASQSGASISAITPALLQWDVPDKFKTRTVQSLMSEAIANFVKMLETDFQKGFWEIVRKWDRFSFRLYLADVMAWPDTVIDFVETVASQTNQFALSVTELIMQNMDFDTTDWRTIDAGMSRLPEGMRHLVGLDNITFAARVTGLEVLPGDEQRVRLTVSLSNTTTYPEFDRVILAIPPAALKMILNRPRWSPEKEMAIRSMHFEPLYKMGLRFKRRFWEQLDPFGSDGGQSTTDLPIRWVVYPSNGIGADGPGVLLVYSWMTDATTWVPLTADQRRDLAINCLADLYDGRKDKQGRTISIRDLFMEACDAVWASSTATGDAMFLPGQFESRFKGAQKPEGPVYFAGEHLSYHHTWISGACDSALTTVRELLHKPDIQPLAAVAQPVAVVPIAPTVPAMPLPTEESLVSAFSGMRVTAPSAGISFPSPEPASVAPTSAHAEANAPLRHAFSPHNIGPVITHLESAYVNVPAFRVLDGLRGNVQIPEAGLQMEGLVDTSVLKRTPNFATGGAEEAENVGGFPEPTFPKS